MEAMTIGCSAAGAGGRRMTCHNQPDLGGKTGDGRPHSGPHGSCATDPRPGYPREVRGGADHWKAHGSHGWPAGCLGRFCSARRMRQLRPRQRRCDFPAVALPRCGGWHLLRSTLPESGCRFSTCTSTTLGLDSPQVENLRPLRATCGHFGQPAATSGNLRPLRTAPSWMPPAVRRLFHVFLTPGLPLRGRFVARPGVRAATTPISISTSAM